MKYKLDRVSQLMLEHLNDEVFIGLVQKTGRIIVLYRAGPEVSEAHRVYPGHRDLPETQRNGARLGFSFHVSGGEIRSFYRNSTLNLGYPWNCISEPQMDDIIQALGVRRGNDFRSYP